MEDNFKIIYRILKILRDSMDLEDFDNSRINNESLKLSLPKWSRIMNMLVSEGYIFGVQIYQTLDYSYPQVLMVRPEISLKGLEFLSENQIMKRIANTAKGIVEVIKP